MSGPDGHTLADSHWDDLGMGPLLIYPNITFMGFPEAFNPADLISNKIRIDYKVVPSHISDKNLYKDFQTVIWEYDKITAKWKAPNGVEESGLRRFFPEDFQAILEKQCPGIWD